MIAIDTTNIVMEKPILPDNIKNLTPKKKYVYRAMKTLFIYDEDYNLSTSRSFLGELKRVFKSKTCSIVLTHVFDTGVTIGYVKAVSRHKILPLGAIFKEMIGYDDPSGYKIYPDFSKELEQDILRYIIQNPHDYACNDVIQLKLDLLKQDKKIKTDTAVGALIKDIIKGKF